MEGGGSRDLFVENALRVLETAEAALQAGSQLTELSILVGADGALRFVSDSGLPLDSLEALHGSRMSYRVRQQGRKVCVEGRAGGRTCLFGAEKPGGAARLPLANLPLYSLVTPPTPNPLPASNALLPPAASG